MSEYNFEVMVPLEQMSGTKGKRSYARKKELVDAITQTKKGELEATGEALKGKRASARVSFALSVCCCTSSRAPIP
jgi:hypothetical protein